MRESIEKFRRHRVRESLLYELQVSDAVYNDIKDKLQTIKQRWREMKYAFLGLFLRFFGLPFHWKRHYFCSEFVSELLAKSQAIALEKRAVAYLPEQLRQELRYRPGVSCLVNVV